LRLFPKTDRGETADQTDQESKSAGHLTAMNLTVHSTFLPHDDPDAPLAFYRDVFNRVE